MPTVLITGAARGIGLAFAQHYKKNAWTVWATVCSRKDDEEIKQLAAVADRIFQLDVGPASSIESLATELNGAPIDLLLNNAGVYYVTTDSLSQLTVEQASSAFAVNAMGPLLLSRALLPNLRLSAVSSSHARTDDAHETGAVKGVPKVACISSRMGSLADNTSGGHYGYRASKAALNMFVKSLSLDVPDVIFLSLHPGYVKTHLVGDGNGDITPEESVAGLSAVIEQADSSYSGRFWNREGKELPW